MSFKILALEVLDACKSEHSKILKKNTPFLFDKNYKLTKENEEIIIELIQDEIDLFSQDFEPKINVSAIVGKNGSGKSTIIELLIKGVNNFFYRYKEDNPNSEFHAIDAIPGIAINIFYKIDSTIYKLKIFENQFGKIAYDLFESVHDRVNKKWTISKAKISIYNNIGYFFYTEVINYSLYAFNSKTEGTWISKLFHKNDGYQTPVVLNPWRDSGLININKENELVYQRLLANLFRYNSKKELNLNLGDNLEAIFLTLKLSDIKYYEAKSIEDFGVDLSEFDNNMRTKILNNLIKIFHNKKSDIKLDGELLEYSKLYIIYKLISICHKYDEYSYDKFYDFNSKKFKNLDNLISLLNEDNSHITFKLRQILNFVVYKHIPFKSLKKEIKIEVKSLAENINNISNNENIINYLPPPIFKTDIELKSIKSNEKNIKFSSLSSGEKQQIYTTSAIYYHLINLESVKDSTNKNKISYKYINVILEEIELYFHPEYQRVFISKLIEGIRNLNLKNIKYINLIFVTHSPFILSDIPNSNIMYLKINSDGYTENVKEKKKSFASNIHHLLGDNFFFENNVYIGELAHIKIKEIIRYIKDGNHQKVEYCLKLIELIDEPILKNKLSEMLIERFPDFHKQNEKEKRENMVKSFAEKMGIEIDIKK
ncbi:AAA family ATPase [Flavobacterium columnare]|uniref:AAA domain-containing protein n=1 Tax=Flavobacterium columnare TaxID=996 RepID=A0AA94JN41_9FLAO|nr:AAA family ATPase [Flavobacterium columnare]MCH4830619.1 AAA family ATPase [Flavobacterium columnare]MCH4833445.1 AAA family ATPase [Flavobacterium columnare]